MEDVLLDVHTAASQEPERLRNLGANVASSVWNRQIIDYGVRQATHEYVKGLSNKERRFIIEELNRSFPI